MHVNLFSYGKCFNSRRVEATKNEPHDYQRLSVCTSQETILVYKLPMCMSSPHLHLLSPHIWLHPHSCSSWLCSSFCIFEFSKQRSKIYTIYTSIHLYVYTSIPLHIYKVNKQTKNAFLSLSLSLNLQKQIIRCVHHTHKYIYHHRRRRIYSLCHRHEALDMVNKFHVV